MAWQHRSVSVRMTVAEREAFLASSRAAILSVAEADGGTIASPVWFHYEPGGDVVLFMEPESLKVAAMKRAGRATVTVQDEGDIVGTGRPPRYVSVTGPLNVDQGDAGRDGEAVRAFWNKYLPGPLAERYVELGGDAFLTGKRYTEASVGMVVRIHPERWFTRDYGKAGERWDRLTGKPGSSTIR